MVFFVVFFLPFFSFRIFHTPPTKTTTAPTTPMAQQEELGNGRPYQDMEQGGGGGRKGEGRGEGEGDIKEFSSPWVSTAKMAALAGVAVVLVLLVGVGVVMWYGGEDVVDSNGKPKNLIFVLADGMSPDSLTFAREMSHFNSKDPSPPLPLDPYMIGHARTYSADSIITDSAAGATAYSCTLKTNNGVIAVSPEGKACATLLEAAKSEGYMTGAVTNTKVTHASPAAFTAHVAKRKEEEEIANQQTYNFTKTLDLLMGGGKQKFEKRKDGVNLLEVLEEEGIKVITKPNELKELDSLPVVGLFAGSHLDFEIDRMREMPPEQPSLSEMVEKTLELFQKDGRPFILFIESGRIDHAAHSNDPGTHYWEMNQYMKTVEVLENFVSLVPETTVFFTSDHATGGISTGRRYNNDTYPEYTWFPEVILGQKQSFDKMATRIKNGEDLQTVYLEETGIDLENDQPEAYKAISSLTPSNNDFYLSALAEPLNLEGMIGWTTVGHTGVDINTYLMGWRGAEGGNGWGIGGVMQNNVIGEQLVKGMGLEQAMKNVQEGFGGWEINLGGGGKRNVATCFHDDDDR